MTVNNNNDNNNDNINIIIIVIIVPPLLADARREGGVSSGSRAIRRLRICNPRALTRADS